MNLAGRIAAHYTPITREQIFEKLRYVPTERQWAFHRSAEDDVLYGGAAGGGKTKALVMEAVAAAAIHSGITVAIFRRTFPELRSEVLPELRKIGFARALGAEWNKGIWEMSFPNGSIIRCLYADGLDDATKYQSAEFQLLVLLERTLFPQGVCAMLIERVRSGSSDVPVLGTRSGSNPGGISHGEVKERFITPTNYGKNIAVICTECHLVTAKCQCEKPEPPETVRFIPAKVTDNPHIDKKYMAKLRGIKDPARRAAMLEGDWDVYAGQAFGEWRNEKHVVKPWRLPASWARYQSIDYGFTAPWCSLWIAIDEDERAWVYRELYETNVGESDQAQKILAAEAEMRSQGIDDSGSVSDNLPHPQPLRRADPSMWAKRGQFQSIAKVYAQSGVMLKPANNDRLSGKARVHSYLAMGPACASHRAMGWEKCPRLHVFDTCTNLIRTLPDLPRDPNKPEDVDTKAEDHAYDTLRYGLMGIGSGAEFYEPDDDVDVEDARFALHDDLGDFAALPDALSVPVTARTQEADSDDWDF
jgi:hypothetical protein